MHTLFRRRFMIVLGLFLFVYLVFGFYTELGFLQNTPLPDTLLQDFDVYEQALVYTSRGESPYQELRIGPSYLYPPPALLLIEIFHSIKSPFLKASVYSALNIALLMLMVYGIARHYGYSTDKIWYWYIVCIGFSPFFELIHLGQINIITMFGIFLLFIFSESSAVVGGVGLALAVLTKVSPILFFLYLFVLRKWKTITTAVVAIVAALGVSILRYGIAPVIEYPAAFQWLSKQIIIDYNAQSFVARVAGLQELLLNNFHFGLPFLNFLAANPGLTQSILNFYLLALILISALLLYLGKQAKEYVFIIISLGMMLSPNLLWYHHYVFILLPLIVWMGWSQLDWRVVLWSLAGLLVIQIDRYQITHGFLNHLFAHTTLLIILFQQIKDFAKRKRLHPAQPHT